LGHVQGIALGTEGGITQTWATGCKTITATVAGIAPHAGTTVTAKARLVAKLARGFAITATETCRGNFGAFLAWAVVTPNGNNGLMGFGCRRWGCRGMNGLSFCGCLL
jgi:hypothetical protein